MTAVGGFRARALGGAGVDAAQLLSAPVRAPRPSVLDEPLKLTRRQAEAAAAIGIETVGDLLEHVPAGHEFRVAKSIAALKNADEASIEAVVQSVQLKPTRRRNFRIVEARVADASGSITAVWFNQAFLVKQLQPGTRVRLFGKVKSGSLQVREHSVLDAADAARSTGPAVAGTGSSVVGVYAATEGLKSQRLRELAAGHRGLEQNVIDPLPARLRAAERLLDRPSAIAEMHWPRTPGTADDARRRLAFEELLLQQLALSMRRSRSVDRLLATPLPGEGQLVGRWLATLPFKLTADQRAAIAAIDADISSERPMQRLLMGEVGSGKTVVALAAMLRAAGHNCQSALMAPTETLAEQHFATLNAMLPDTPIALLTGSTSARRRREMLARLASGELPLVVGTHALIEPTVEFRSLVLAVVDEQHRFGVRQRAALDAKAPAGRVPHVLHMTATPIPRTLALTGWGDLDFTLIRELPSGRKPVGTRVIGEAQRAAAYSEVRERLSSGRQAYVVCPLVSESEELQVRAAVSEAERLAAGEFSAFQVGLLHGQMSSGDKSAAMAAFKCGDTDVLVATSVVEVGVDVPNATVMIVEDAERYGISQLHQLRGRIGRGEHQSLCLLFGAPASPRLRAVASERDGFKLAEVDLKLRGAGEELGTRQSGLPRFRVAMLPEDAPLLERAAAAARQLLAADPGLDDEANELLRAAVTARYGEEIDPIPA